MLNSAARIALPPFDPDELQKLIETLVAVDGEKWLPKSRPGTFLYLRPTMIANGTSLGVQKPKEALLYIMACCFPSFDNGRGVAGLDDATLSLQNERLGLKLLASKENTVRAWPGGFGYAKVGANYGPSLIAQGEARARGFDQVLWLLGQDCEVTEAGSSNFFCRVEDKGGQGPAYHRTAWGQGYFRGRDPRKRDRLGKGEVGGGIRGCGAEVFHVRGRGSPRGGKAFGGLCGRHRSM